MTWAKSLWMLVLAISLPHLTWSGALPPTPKTCHNGGCNSDTLLPKLFVDILRRSNEEQHHQRDDTLIHRSRDYSAPTPKKAVEIFIPEPFEVPAIPEVPKYTPEQPASPAFDPLDPKDPEENPPTHPTVSADDPDGITTATISKEDPIKSASQTKSAPEEEETETEIETPDPGSTSASSTTMTLSSATTPTIPLTALRSSVSSTPTAGVFVGGASEDFGTKVHVLYIVTWSVVVVVLAL